MQHYTIVLGTDYLGIKVQGVRADGSPGVILPNGALSYSSSDESIATVHQQPGQPTGFDECRVVPVAPGQVTITALGADESGNPITSDFMVSVVGQENPTVGYTFTQIHP